ncbi:MAG: ATP-binding cassette domain-containing protein, partial [Woeseiaceae bacterium]|nr:ATP-binding cassette domain-containing protein [Woeseiaceae bacterium]
MSLLEVKDLTIRYDYKTVVDAVSFEVNRGESVGLAGESGSGKSQTAMALLGLLPRNATRTGSIRFDHTEISTC